jgi:cell division protein FtsQ
MAGNRRKFDRAQASADLKSGAATLGRALMVLAALGAGGFALAIAGQAGYRWLTTSPTFAVRTLELRGNRRAPSDELVRLSGLAVGRNIFASDVEGAEAALAGEPWVKTVEVHRRLPDTVVIRVTEREPALVVDLGKLYFADAEGTLFKRALGGDDLDLPIVTGLSRQTFQDNRAQTEARLREIYELTQSFHARGLDARFRLQELAVDPDDGLTVQLAPVNARAELQAVKLGEAPYEEKLEKLATLWDELQRRGLKAQVIHLENRTRPNWVAVKLALAEAPAASAKPAHHD